MMASSSDSEPVPCPFCGYKAENEYGIWYHVASQHPEPGVESPFVVTGDDGVDGGAEERGNGEGRGFMERGRGANEETVVEDENFVYCPVEGCGEALLLTELEAHVEMHAEEEGEGGEYSPVLGEPSDIHGVVRDDGDEGFDTKLAYALRNLEDVDVRVHERNERNGRKEGAKSAWGQILKMPDQKKRRKSRSPERERGSPGCKSMGRRLGKAELGPHANEKQMPAWLVTLLQSDGRVEIINKIDRDGATRIVKTCPNMAEGVVPVIAQLLEQDPNIAYAYVCNPVVRHVSKLRREGGFCGYRNIQMLSSYMIAAEMQGYEILGGKIPTIFQIQEWIESAWDNGINAQGRIETGGVKGTRKYIGTPEAQAMLLNLGITCDAQAFKSRKGPSPKQAYELILVFAESYFTSGCTDYDPKVRRTALPPVYLQHPGHSVTIIGFQKSKDGNRELLVFDPMFHDSPQILKLVNLDKMRHRRPEELLKAYRRGSKYLRKYQEFEVLRLAVPGMQVSS